MKKRKVMEWRKEDMEEDEIEEGGKKAKWKRCKPIGEKRKKVKLKRKKDNRNGRRKDKTQKGR